MKIISDRGPSADEVIARLDIYAKGSPYEGGILFAGQDPHGAIYEPRTEPSGSYRLPSDTLYSVAVGDTPAIHFGFELHSTLRYPDILTTKEFDDAFYDHFSIKVYDDTGTHIDLTSDSEMDDNFKFVACWGVWELACDTEAGKVSNHFWGEMFLARKPQLAAFLEQFRKPLRGGS